MSHVSGGVVNHSPNSLKSFLWCEARRARYEVDVAGCIAADRAYKEAFAFGALQAVQILKGLSIELGVLRFGCLSQVQASDCIAVPLSSSLLQEIRVHSVALIALALDSGLEIVPGGLHVGCFQFRLGDCPEPS